MANTKTKPTPKRTGQAAPLADKALKARWAEAVARYRDAKASETKSWDDEYEALGEILESDPPYYLAGGYKTARAFLAAELPGVTERTARRNIRVARYFDPEDEEMHGITKLDALLDYLEAAGGAPVAPAKIHLKKQRVRVARGKLFRHEPFADVSIDDIRAAARRARGGKDKFDSPTVKAVRAILSKAGFDEVSVSIRNNQLHFGGVAVGRLVRFANALARAKV